jgi:hypothetical protein
LIIAHPMSPNEPFCSGCLWQFEDARPGVALGVEVWNGSWDEFNEEALQQYYLWLNMGHRLVATTGSDIHGPFPLEFPRRDGFNVVYAEQLTEEAILSAVRKGHSYLSAGPELLLTAETTSGKSAMVGDVLPAEDVTLRVKFDKAHTGDQLRLIVDGKVHATQSVSESGEYTWDLPAGSGHWVTAELRDPANKVWAIANPIYLGMPQLR